MIDDHDRWEWVNVSSGTAHVGCPGQSPDSHIMVVVVVVVTRVTNTQTVTQTMLCQDMCRKSLHQALLVMVVMQAKT